MKITNRWRILAVAAATVMLGGLAAAPAQAAPALAPGFTQMNTYLVAHPDDEGSSFGMMENTSAYKVLVMLTAGDATGYCRGNVLNPGEYTPVAGFPHEPNTQGCIDNRRDSFHKAYDDQATIDSGFEARGALTTITAAVLPSDFTDDVGGPDNGAAVGDPRTVQFFVGSKNTRVLFNLGDGNLTPQEVRWAVNTVKRNINLLPAGLTYRDVVGLSYANTQDRKSEGRGVWDTPFYGGITNAAIYANCDPYQHPDHVAVHRALYDYDLAPEQASSAQYASTCAADPKVVHTDYTSTARWNWMMQKGTTLGSFQYRYGWLASGSWNYGNGEDQTEVFHQKGSYWRRY